MSTLIPCTPNGSARWVQRTQMTGRDYQLTFDWNQRDGHWTLGIADQDGVDIAVGMHLVTGYSLLRTCRDPRRPGPGGVLAIVDTQNTGLDPGFSDLGASFLLFYFEPGEPVPS